MRFSCTPMPWRPRLALDIVTAASATGCAIHAAFLLADGGHWALAAVAAGSLLSIGASFARDARACMAWKEKIAYYDKAAALIDRARRDVAYRRVDRSTNDGGAES